MGLMMSRRRQQYDERAKQIVESKAKEAAKIEQKAEDVAVQEEKAEKKKKAK